ncbi:hypothetical protein [Cronobacter condimenti]|uniref:hypothetical protein n=2 Tax=Cronobacter condimenti TaxID=1163710 RepID=UPI001D05369F|nr:hypothetical protein [Cronobacter condimenti]
MIDTDGYATGNGSRFVGSKSLINKGINETSLKKQGVVKGEPRGGKLGEAIAGRLEATAAKAEALAPNAAKNAGKGATQAGKQIRGVPVTQSKNPLNPVQQYDAHGNEIFYRTMSQKQDEKFLNTGVMPATTETSVSPVLGYSSKYDGVTVKIVVKPGHSQGLKR